MKVLHIVGDSAYGGGSKVILRIAESIRECDHDVRVLATNDTFIAEARSLGIFPVPIDCIWRPIRPARDVRGLQRLTRYLQSERYDLVHTHTSKAGFVGRRAAWTARVPAVVHTVHGFAFHERSRPAVVGFYTLLERMAAAWCHRIVTVSEFHRQWALRLGIGDDRKVIAICNGITEAPPLDESSRREIRQEFGLGESAVVIISAGRLAEGKGLSDLIDVVARIVAMRRHELALLLPGRGPLERALRDQVARLNLQSVVIMPGYRSDIRRLVAASDIVALPSLREGLSIALLEGMSAGKAIVASDIGSNREVTENGRGALLVPARSPRDLETAIVTLVERGELRTELARESRRIFREKYREEAMLASYRRLYSELGVACPTS